MVCFYLAPVPEDRKEVIVNNFIEFCKLNLSWLADNHNIMFQFIIIMTLVVYMFASGDTSVSDKIITAFIAALNLSNLQIKK